MQDNSVPRISVEKPDKGSYRLLNVQEFYNAILPKSTNGRLGTSNNALFEMMPDPKKKPTVVEVKTWREKVKANLVRREEMIKGLPSALKERARVKVYDHVFGWILDDLKPGSRLGKYPIDAKIDEIDVPLHL